jgi:hypothetical protein
MLTSEKGELLRLPLLRPRPEARTARRNVVHPPANVLEPGIFWYEMLEGLRSAKPAALIWQTLRLRSAPVLRSLTGADIVC